MKKVAIVRGKFLNAYEMQFYEPLGKTFDITAFGSLTPYHDHFAFPVIHLPSPMDLPDFPYKMPFLNRLFTDAHYLLGLEKRLMGFDLVHTAETYFHYTQQALNAKKQGYVKKVVATVLENIPLNNEGIRGRKQFKERARREMDHIIALTKLTRESLIKEGTDPKKISVISHYIDTKRFTPTDSINTSKNITILFVGRLEEYKGIFDVLESFRQLQSDKDLSLYTLRMRFVGDGSRKQELQSRIHKNLLNLQSSIESAKYLDMPGIYRSADIFVAPSKSTLTWMEQYGTMLLEAQAAGLAIVTTNSGGIPENVGDAAMLVKPGDNQAITHSLKTFIINSRIRNEFKIKSRYRAIHVHDIHIGAKKLADLYATILS